MDGVRRLACPAFPRDVLRSVPARRMVRVQALTGGPVAGVNMLRQNVVRWWLRPVGGQVQHRTSLWSGQPCGDGDDLATQGRTACHGVFGAGQGAGGAEQVVGDRVAGLTAPECAVAPGRGLTESVQQELCSET